MSTDRKRLNKAIQRIAREDPKIRKLMEDFRNSGGKPGESATSGSGAEDRQICCDGGTSGSTNPGSDTRDTGDGGQDGLGDDPASLDDMGGGSLTGVTDCATGTPICFEGSDWIPPDGWESPTSPPPKEGYEEGFYWDSPQYSVPDQACAATHAAGPYAGEYAGARYLSEGTYECLEDDAGISLFAFSNKHECQPSDGADCGQNPPLAESWPVDGCVNLAIKSGKIVGSKYDPDQNGSYSAPRDSIDLCDSQGNQISLAPSADGGWKTINSTTDSGYLYDSSGRQIAHIDGNEYSDPAI